MVLVVWGGERLKFHTDALDQTQDPGAVKRDHSGKFATEINVDIENFKWHKPWVLYCLCL